MANTHRGEYALELGGKVYNVRLTFNGVAEAEQRGYFGPAIGVTDVLGRMASMHLFFSDLRALFWAACRGQTGVETIEDAGDVLGSEPNKLTDIGNVLSQALADLFPQAEDAEGN